jgi:hypothetical protein
MKSKILYLFFFLNIICKYKLFRTSSDEKTDEQPEKLDFKKLRNKFENLEKSETPPPHVYKKRPSMPVTSTNTFQSSLNSSKFFFNLTSFSKFFFSALASKFTTINSTGTVRPSQLLKARSSSPSSDGTNNTPKPNVPRIAFNNKPSIEEQDNSSSSPVPMQHSDESSSVSENENNERPKSVQSVNS